MTPLLTSNQRFALLALRQLHRGRLSAVHAVRWRAKANELAGRRVSFQPEALVRRKLVSVDHYGAFYLATAGDVALKQAKRTK